ncbi:MAG: hypothetical protein RL701_269 [Pseudomonadota bacterium]
MRLWDTLMLAVALVGCGNAVAEPPQTGSVVAAAAASPFCQNGIVDILFGEQCDPSVSGDNWSCDRETCTPTGLTATAYQKTCTNNNECGAQEVCDGSFFGGGICMARCVQGACVLPAGYTGTCSSRQPANGYGSGCLIKCSTKAECPPTVDCWNGMCLMSKPQ